MIQGMTFTGKDTYLILQVLIESMVEILYEKRHYLEFTFLKMQSLCQKLIVMYVLPSISTGTYAFIYCLFSLQVYLFIPVTFVLGCVFMIVVSFWAAPFECLVGSSIILTGIPAYLLGYKWKKPHVVKKMLGKCKCSVCLFSRAAISLHHRLLLNSCEYICSSAAADADTFGLFK